MKNESTCNITVRWKFNEAKTICCGICLLPCFFFLFFLSSSFSFKDDWRKWILNEIQKGSFAVLLELPGNLCFSLSIYFCTRFNFLIAISCTVLFQIIFAFDFLLLSLSWINYLVFSLENCRFNSLSKCEGGILLNQLLSFDWCNYL